VNPVTVSSPIGVILAAVGSAGSRKLTVGVALGKEPLEEGGATVESAGVAALPAEQAESSNMAAKRA
jgi:hypothetical protein